MKLSTLFSTTFPKIILGYFSFCAVVYLFKFGGLSNKHFDSILYLHSFFLIILAVFWIVKEFGARHPQGKAFLLIGIGLCLATIGQITWDVLSYFTSVDPLTYSSIFFFLGYIVALIGFIKEIRALHIHWENHPLFGYTPIIISIALLLGLGVVWINLSPLLSGLPDTLTIVGFAYVVGDLTLIIVSTFMFRIFLEYKQGLLSHPWLLVFIGQCTILVGDVLIAIFNPLLIETMWPYSLVNFLWLAANLLIALGFYGISQAVHMAQVKIQEHVPSPHTTALS